MPSIGRVFDDTQEPTRELRIQIPDHMLWRLREHCSLKQVSMSSLVRELIAREVGDPQCRAEVVEDNIKQTVAQLNHSLRRSQVSMDR